MSGVRVSVVVPTYNEAQNIVEVITRLQHTLNGWAHEIVVVDDDSPDGTAQIVEDRFGCDETVRVLCRVGCRGLASAVLEGMAVAWGDVLAVIDGDLQHDESVLPAMVTRVLEGGADVCVASRNRADGLPGSRTLPRRFATATGTWMACWLLPSLRACTDPLSGFFAVSRAHYGRTAGGACAGVRSYKVLWLFLSHDTPTVAEVGFCFRPRAAGATKLSARVLIDDLAVALALRTGAASAAAVKRRVAAAAAIVGAGLCAAAWVVSRPCRRRHLRR